MAARSKARKRALDVLYENDVRGLPLDGTLDERIASAETTGHLPVHDYTVRLVRGVAEHRGRLDALLSSYSEGWTLERMPSVDRNILRVGLYEVLYVDDVPDAVAVDEAVTLARDLSTEESPAFVNGVLGNVVRNKAALTT